MLAVVTGQAFCITAAITARAFHPFPITQDKIKYLIVFIIAFLMTFVKNYGRFSLDIADFIIVHLTIAVDLGPFVAMHGYTIPVKDPLAHFIGVVSYFNLF